MNALLINNKDNVVVVTIPVDKGSIVEFTQGKTTEKIMANDDIPIYHKVAIKDIETGEKVMKYGNVIGKATRKIKTGEHVHCHNVVSAEEGRAAGEDIWI